MKWGPEGPAPGDRESLNHLLSLKVVPGRILDLGCGPGHLLNEARRRGWDPVGIDISERDTRFAKDEYGLDQVQIGSIEDADFEAASFDVVVIVAVIEHLLEPLTVVKRTASFLKSGGQLLIQTDNVKSLSRLALQGSWPFFTPPIHLQNFSVAGLKTLVQNAGFRVISCRTAHEIQPSQLARRLRIAESSAKRITWFASPLFELARRTGLGELIELTAEKP
jgi:2-polyprenyl-3-methyl-5-hydroxy-6-metoxy-1,4-benzoquinol methylase